MIRTKEIVFILFTVILSLSLLPKISLAEQKNFFLGNLKKLEKTHPQILDKENLVKKSAAQIKQAKTSWYPNIKAGASASSYITEPSSFGSNNGEIANLDITINQPLYRGGRTGAKIEETELILKANKANLELTKQNLLLEAAIIHADLAKDLKIVKLREKNVKTLTKQLEYEEDRYKLGENTITDVTQAKSRLAASKANLMKANGNLLNSLAKYKRMIGNVSISDIAPELPNLNLKTLDIENLDKLIQIGFKNNPAIKVISLQKYANFKEQRFIKGEYYPSLDLIGTSKRFYNPSFAPNEPYQDQSSITIQASIPLYLGGSVKYKLEQAKHENKQITMQLADVKREIEQKITIFWQNIKIAKTEIQARESQLETTNIALNGVKEEFSLGSRTTLDVLNAEEEKLNAEVELIIAKHSLITAEFSLINALGLFSIEKISEFLGK